MSFFADAGLGGFSLTGGGLLFGIANTSKYLFTALKMYQKGAFKVLVSGYVTVTRKNSGHV